MVKEINSTLVEQKCKLQLPKLCGGIPWVDSSLKLYEILEY